MQAILRIYTKYIGKRESSEKVNSAFYNYFVVPFSAGLAGFSTFLFILIMMDASAHLLGITKAWNVGINEVLIAAVGFILQFTFQLIKSIMHIN